MPLTEKDFYKAFEDSLLNSGFKKGQNLLVAFSGGCDSLALLVMSTKVLGKDNVFPIYVNHNLRSEEELLNEIALNKENCEKLKLKLHVCTIEKGQVNSLAKERKNGLEEAARVLRYNLLEEKRKKLNCTFIATAHHKQDQIENIIMALSSGSPFSSLVGIREYEGQKHLVRPLLSYDKKSLESFLLKEGFSWSTDSTNSDSSMERNNIRNNVVPILDSQWPHYEEVLLSLQKQSVLMSFSNIYSQENCVNGLDIKEIIKKSTLERVALIYGLWDSLMNDKQLPMTLVSRVLDSLSNGEEKVISSNNGAFQIYKGKLYFSSLEKETEYKNFEREVKPLEGNTIILPEGVSFSWGNKSENSINPHKDLYLDNSLFCGKVRIRFPKDGDYIKLKGGKRMLKRLLQDMNIPSIFRCRVPILVDDEGLCA
ncbi:MAG: tRNA lysidine(34) synthetase TilS, partial [Sphaerochaetaceae bacterium]|nr:tRNA lysidine(34) synthetase TilS [Sphaerochaetaceae bacterium]